MKKKIFVVAAILISSRLFSQETDSTVVDMVEFPWGNVELSRVVITATRYPIKQSQTGKVMTVIGKSVLDRSVGKSLGEVLNTTVGTTIVGANNNPGTNLTVSIRGSSSGNVLILIDGIPVNDPSVNTNYFDINLIPIDEVERIEILKGGQSTLYGSDAVAGVINIILKKSATKPFAITGNLSGGSYNTFKENIGISGKQKSVNYSIGYTHINSKGFSSAYDRNKTDTFDQDGFDQHAGHARINISLTKRLKAVLSGMYSFYKTDLDYSAYTDERDYDVKNHNGMATAGLVYDHKTGSLHFLLL